MLIIEVAWCVSMTCALKFSAPSSWTPHDVQEWIATLGDGEFAELGSFYAGYSGEDLIALTREDFVALAGPGNEELAGKLYEALKTQEKEFEEQTDSK